MKYVLIDAAILNDQMFHLKKMNPSFQSLYMGEEGKLMDSVAPFLFQIQKESPFSDWFLQYAPNNPCGYILDTDVSFKDLHHHFRKFLKVKTEAGKKLYFRFYDPRVLPTFLRTCTSQQLEEFFGPIKSFTLITSEEEFLHFYLKDRNLMENIISQNEDTVQSEIV